MIIIRLPTHNACTLLQKQRHTSGRNDEILNLSGFYYKKNKCRFVQKVSKNRVIFFSNLEKIETRATK